MFTDHPIIIQILIQSVGSEGSERGLRHAVLLLKDGMEGHQNLDGKKKNLLPLSGRCLRQILKVKQVPNW